MPTLKIVSHPSFLPTVIKVVGWVEQTNKLLLFFGRILGDDYENNQ
jgi:hypothetical protein